MDPRARRHLIWFTLASLLACGAGACGAAYKGGEAASAAMDSSPRSEEAYGAPEMPVAAAPPPPGEASPADSPKTEAAAESKPSADKDGKSDAGKGASKPPATTWKRSQLAAHSVKVDVGDNESLPVRSMQAKVLLDGFMARVVLDMVVKNNGPRQYEGTLKLRLPTGSSPYYFAFGQDAVAIAGDAPPAFFTPERVRTMGSDPIEIRNDRQSLWAGVKEARMVPKEKAALAYTSTVRRQVDPALLEWSGPSIFNARVFPLVPNKNHRIVIGYDVPLTKIGDDLEYTFDLPDNVGSKALDLAVTPPQGAEVEATPAVKPFEDKVRKFYRYDDPAAKTVTIRLKKPAPTYVVGTDGPTGSYFAANVTPQIPATSAAKGRDSALFLVDTSLSSNPDRFNVWLELLRSVLENNQDTIKNFNVMFFNIEQSFFKPSFVANDPTNRQEAMNFANTLALEGATDVGAALVRATKVSTDVAKSWDVFLLSDGSATWGESDAFTMVRRLEKTPVGSIYAYQTGLAGTDSDALSLLTRETGGAVFSVTGGAEVKQA
ncbi:MAG TPA: VWA domain-containing protein, partial [Polyangium sp.]|nr:VWA domain-containing protein [Polyangium sp.]